MVQFTASSSQSLKPSTESESAYLRALTDRVLVYDGAMGTNIQLHHPTPEDFGGKSLEGCNDHLVLTRPDIIQLRGSVKLGEMYHGCSL